MVHKFVGHEYGRVHHNEDAEEGDKPSTFGYAPLQMLEAWLDEKAHGKDMWKMQVRAD